MSFTKLPEHARQLLEECYESYLAAIEKNGHLPKIAEENFNTLIPLVIEQLKRPYQFQISHDRIQAPFDFYRFGIDFFSPLIQHVSILGEKQLVRIQDQLKAGDNVIFFANHQVEPDPQILCHALEKNYPEIAGSLRFVAGHRVTTDPLSIPFSLGCNLLCIFSKKHIEHPPELKAEKIKHNHLAINKLGELLNKGSQAIYVAPSGGRDRKDENGVVALSPFDPQSIEMFYFLANHSKAPTHFYPLALATYAIAPPPETVERAIGERRLCFSAPVSLSFGEELVLQAASKDKHEQRLERCNHIFECVKEQYRLLTP